MRPKTMILFVIAVGCGLVASIGVSQYMESGALGQAVETEQIFVAVTDINIGEKLDAQNVKLEEWPKDRIPEGAVRELEELEELYPRTRLYAGEPILRAKLMDSRDRGSKALTIPKGYRVVSVKVSVESSVSGLVQPGDRVDLMVFLRKSGEVPETGTKTILRDVNVFSVDGETERSLDAEGDARNVRTVSLLVKPDQAEAVMLASELGELYLSLRRPDDDVEADGDGISIHTLLGTAPESANDEAAESRLPQTDLAHLLQRQAEQAATALSKPAEAEPPRWRMQILSPTGLKEYRWSDLNQMPEEFLYGQSHDTTSSAGPAAKVIRSPVTESEAEEEEDEPAPGSFLTEEEDAA